MLVITIVIVLAITTLFGLYRKYKIDTFNIVERDGGKYVLQTVTLVNDFPNKEVMEKINSLLWRKLIGSYYDLGINDEDPQKCDGDSDIKNVEISGSWLSFRQHDFFFCETAAHPSHGSTDYNIDLNSGSIVDLKIEIEKNVKDARQFREIIISKFIDSIPEMHDYFNDWFDMDMEYILNNYYPSYLIRANKLIIKLEGFCYAASYYEQFEINLTFKELCQYFKDSVDPILSGFCQK